MIAFSKLIRVFLAEDEIKCSVEELNKWWLNLRIRLASCPRIKRAYLFGLACRYLNTKLEARLERVEISWRRMQQHENTSVTKEETTESMETELNTPAENDMCNNPSSQGSERLQDDSSHDEMKTSHFEQSCNGANSSSKKRDENGDDDGNNNSSSGSSSVERVSLISEISNDIATALSSDKTKVSYLIL